MAIPFATLTGHYERISTPLTCPKEGLVKNFVPYFLFMVCEIFAVIVFEIWKQTPLAIALGVLGAGVWLVSMFIMGRKPSKEKHPVARESSAPVQ